MCGETKPEMQGWDGRRGRKKKEKKKAEPEARAVLRNLPRGFWVNVHG